MFFRGRAFVEVMAERILDEGSSSSSSSLSLSSSDLRPLYSEAWPNVSGRSRAPVTSKMASSSKENWNNIRYDHGQKREESLTF